MTPRHDADVWNGVKPMVAPMPPADITVVGVGWTAWARSEGDYMPRNGIVHAVDRVADEDGVATTRLRLVDVYRGVPRYFTLKESEVDVTACSKAEQPLVVQAIKALWRHGAARSTLDWTRREDDVLNTTWRLARAVEQ